MRTRNGELSVPMSQGMGTVEGVFVTAGFYCLATSIMDGTHGKGSRHPWGDACDFRTKHAYTGLPDRRQRIDALVEECREHLGDDFDVVLEGFGTANEHLHVEHDPKW